MQTTTMRSSPTQAPALRSKPFSATRVCPKARKPATVTAAQVEDKARVPVRIASGLLAAVAAAQLSFAGAAQADILDNAKQIFSPGDAQDIKEGKGQAPSDKYVAQAKKFASPQAAEMEKNSPDVNDGEGGSMGIAAFQAGNQAKEGRGVDTYKDIRGGTPTRESKAQAAPRLPDGWMNTHHLFDLSAAPIVSKDAEAANDGKANLPQPGGVSKALTDVGKKVTGALPNPPDVSNPKGSQGVPTVSKLAKNPTKDVASNDFAAGDNKPNFPTPPNSNPGQSQDVFKQIGDKLRGGIGEGAPNPGKIGQGIADNVNGPDPKAAAKEITQNLPEKIQSTSVAPESIGAKANARNN